MPQNEGMHEIHGRFRRLIWKGGADIDLGESETCSSCYLLETGLVAEYVVIDRTRLTCVGFRGPGALINPGGDAPRTKAIYRSVMPASVVEIPTQQVWQTMHQVPRLKDAYLAQAQERLAAIRQVAACNAHHSVSQRAAHWLLELHELIEATLPITHEGLAALLGVRRAGVTVTLQELQRCGAIRQHRGRIVVADADRLRSHACSCPIGSRPNTSLSDLLISANVDLSSHPRNWIESEIQARIRDEDVKGEAWLRREATLQVCRSIRARGQALLMR